MLGYVEAGILLRNLCDSLYAKMLSQTSVNKTGMYIVSGCVIFGAIGTLASNYNGFAEVRIFQYGKYPVLFIISALFLSVAWIGLSILFHKSKLLQRIGKATIAILCLHKFPMLVFQTFVGVTVNMLSKENSWQALVAAFCVSIVCIALCLVTDIVLSKIAPVVIGKRDDESRKQEK